MSMKGLDVYIAKHGKHFTEKLVKVAIKNKWKSSEVKKISETFVYYNVSEATLGDITFLANLYYWGLSTQCPSRSKCIEYALEIIGDMDSNGYAFDVWALGNKDINLNDYI